MKNKILIALASIGTVVIVAMLIMYWNSLGVFGWERLNLEYGV